MTLDRIDTKYAVFLNAETSVNIVERKLAALPTLNFIHIQHDESRFPNQNLIGISRKEPSFKPLLVCLANHGFHLYVLRDNVSSFVRHRRIPTLWQPVKSGEILVDENYIHYRLVKPEALPVKKLLVVFSSIASSMYTASLVRHFEPNFKSISKYITSGTAILRIADLGGVLGSFYLNSNAMPENQRHVSALLDRVRNSLGLQKQDVVLYGTSKGGTASTFYCLNDGYRAVAVDPILSDQHYVDAYADSHFTLGTFPQTKQEVFTELVEGIHDEADLTIIYSTRSPQFKYIDAIIGKFENRFTFLNSQHEMIKDHPDVGPMTLPHMLSQLNAKLAGLPNTTIGCFNID